MPRGGARKKRIGGPAGTLQRYALGRFGPEDGPKVWLFMLNRLERWGPKRMEMELGIGAGTAQRMMDEGGVILSRARDADEWTEEDARRVISCLSPPPPPESP
jgi:hypothetical protein